MAPGIVLIILGGIFAFALEVDSPWLDLRVLGVILMLGGVAFIARSRFKRREVITRETETTDAGAETEETRTVERRVD